MAARIARDVAVGRLAEHRAARLGLEAEIAALRAQGDPTAPDAYTLAGRISAGAAHRRAELARLNGQLARLRSESGNLSAAAARASARAALAEKLIAQPQRRR